MKSHDILEELKKSAIERRVRDVAKLRIRYRFLSFFMYIVIGILGFFAVLYVSIFITGMNQDVEMLGMRYISQTREIEFFSSFKIHVLLIIVITGFTWIPWFSYFVPLKRDLRNRLDEETG